jgi:hypothetical protein
LGDENGMKVDIGLVREAVAYLSVIPDSQWDMSVFYATDKPCGCALGWLGKGNKCGVRMDTQNVPTALVHGVDVFNLFGDDSHWVFSPLSVLEERQVILQGLTHKQIFFSRVRQFMQRNNISESEVFGAKEENENEQRNTEFA